MGLGSRVAEFQRQVLQPLARRLFPGVGDELETFHAFVVRYMRDRDVELAPHRDDAEVTFNMALVQRTRGCRLVFCGLMQDRDVHQHRLSHQFPGEGWAVLHLGRQVHATEPIIQGERSNLVIWSRSWAWRAAGGDGQLPTVPPEMPGHAMCGRAKVSGFDAIFACPFGCHPACCFLLKAYWSSHGNKPQHPCKSKFFNQLLPRTPTNTPAKHTSNNGLLQPFPKCV
ncbi:unnamed protein product [Effrenium voratum]|nr:unnamed protein product [Effrenium voratum]